MNVVIRAILALSFLGLAALPARAETHALIMTIGAYQGAIPQLRGVQYDADSAKQIAEHMGVKDRNMRFYKDGQLTLEGMRQAFAELEQRVAPGDQVFIYYSGHGTRQRVQDPEERCAEALVTADGKGFVDSEMELDLRRLSEKAQKIVALLDACHSGGVTTRGTAAKSALFAPKFVARSGSDSCERPVNVLTRSIRLRSESPGSGGKNYVYVAAARDNEVSLDMPSRGGVATQAWRDCMTNAVDQDGSGALSADEIRACAQQRINTMLKGVQGFSPHNVTITGNQNAVLTFAERSSPAPVTILQAPAAPKPVAVPTSAELPKPVATTKPVATPTVAESLKPVAAPTSVTKPTPAAGPALPGAYYTLNDVLNSRDDRRVVNLKPAKPAFKIGKDQVSFTLNSSHAGYVYLLMVGSDGKTFDMLFPNQIDGANSIDAGQSLQLPRASWEIKAGGPPGKNYLLAIVTDAPRNFSGIGMQASGPFSMVSANLASSKDIQLVSATSAAAQAPECSDPPSKRTLQVQRRCSNAYGAAMAVIEEAN